MTHFSLFFTTGLFVETHSDLQRRSLCLFDQFLSAFHISMGDLPASEFLKRVYSFLDAINDILRQLVLEVVKLGLCLISRVLDVHLGYLELLPLRVLFFELLGLFDHAIYLRIADSAGVLDHH